MSVLAESRRPDDRMQALAKRLDRASWKVETLEEQLADARADARAEARAAKRQVAAAERKLDAARARARVAKRDATQTLGTGVAVDGVQRLALSKTEAAKALGVSVDFFDAHIALELGCVRRGRRRLYPTSEVERWLAETAERVG
jgi:hypothetical protein